MVRTRLRPYFSARPDGEADSLRVRGAVAVHVAGRKEVAAPASPELQAALREPRARPYRTLLSMPFIGSTLDAALPAWFTQGMGINFYFGGTSLLIVVGVAMDTVQQVESQLVMRNYEGFMKKGRIRGRR